LKAISQAARLQKWKFHFQTLLGPSPVIIDRPIQKMFQYQLPIKKGPFNLDELQKALKSTKNGKAAGLDTIPPEV